MSPLVRGVARAVLGFPRVSGDEPGPAPGMVPTVVFSPRERG